ncbi:hypothetical protein GGI23_003157 [Coemansia sp. RSA 2559]|nr:hypothetical protein GGI23_003157 [Coemansia sp. RSA 2559]KAJ2869195.1 hypothetical protein GGI22_000410 [Coemansia erecta]
MRFATLATIFGLVSCAAAAPYYGGVTQVIGLPPVAAPPVGGVYPGSGATNPGSGATYPSGGNNGSGNSGSGNNGSGSNGSGSNGSGSNGSGSSGNGSGGSGSQVGNPSECGLPPGKVAALTPLVNELQLTRTVDDLKHLTKQITDLLADTLQESAVSSILNIVDNLVAGLGLGGLDLKPTVDSVTSILRKQVPCLLDTLLPKP